MEIYLLFNEVLIASGPIGMPDLVSSFNWFQIIIGHDEVGVIVVVAIPSIVIGLPQKWAFADSFQFWRLQTFCDHVVVIHDGFNQVISLSGLFFVFVAVCEYIIISYLGAKEFEIESIVIKFELVADTPELDA